MAFSPDGEQIVSGRQDGLIHFWDQQGKLLQTFEGHDGRVMSVALSPDGKTLASGGEDTLIRLWDGQGKPPANSAGP